MALRRWKPFLGAFQHIDAAIEASSGDGVSRDEFRKARGRIVELLCDAAATGDGGGDGEAAAEGLGLLLDEAMAGSLATLREVPAGRIPELLAAAPGGLVGAVGALMKDHASERVRVLARDVVREWKLCVGAELARARTAMDVLNGISEARPKKEEAKIIPEEEKEKSLPKKTAVVSSSRRICAVESYAPLCKKRAPAVVSTTNAKLPSENTDAPEAVPAQPSKKPTNTAVVTVANEEHRKMEATKRKLQERYQEAEDAKRRRTIQVIKPPRPETKTDQRQSSAHPAMMKARGPAASGTAERRFMNPSSRPIRV